MKIHNNSRAICRLAAGIALLCCTLQVAAQDKKIAALTKEALLTDFDLIVNILKQQHPNLYKFTDSVSFAHQTDSLRKVIAQQPTLINFLQHLPNYLVKDVHLSLNLSDDYEKELNATLQYFPYPVVIERDRVFINIKGAAIPYGTELISINNIPVKKVLDELAVHAYSDGYITTGTDRIARNFQFYFSLHTQKNQPYQVAYKETGTNKTRQITLPAVDPTTAYHATSQAVLPVNVLQRAYHIYDNFFDASQTGLLTVNTFSLNESAAYKEFSQFFREVNKRQYKQVIIDIRNNGGGNPAIAALLYSFLAKAPFRNVYNYRTKTISISYPEYATDDNNRRYSEEDIRSDKNFYYQRFDKDSTGFYVGNNRLKEGLLEDFPPDKDAFHGDVYILTGGGTVSAATYFASLVQKNQRGTIIGKETGSGVAATTAAWFITYLLPGTQSRLSIPRAELYFFNATTDNGHGILPDQEVPLSSFIRYMQAGKDPELSYTLEVLRKQ
ncbi:S41 family peptidase [Chitinophaga nivalis]|uniref:S41 family peptidase n=1 Tax=Chitinophaga nivalis TaxID=2991709 RepID=A0ABT3IIS1_9BACT|nr:S41 family peptidase [Chitinophaga nivalis]MCW3466456.1 S41 family peptidase [Chitinophaga nivalis]MCW3483853.1 S41 family peptidase [Chitinophaga nivalis]